MKRTIYKDKKGEWRWRIKAGNGRIMADSGEGYKRKRSLVDAMRKLDDFFWSNFVGDKK